MCLKIHASDLLDKQVDLLSRIHHRNLVSLLGYCNESREVMLIYDYMSGGSLRDHLYGKFYRLGPECVDMGNIFS
jgi:serine/threonine protein kinase